MRSPFSPADGPHAVRQLAGTRVRGWDRWADRLARSDPGLNRFRTALQAALTVAVILVAEDLFVRLTRALQIQAAGTGLPAAKAAQVVAVNHEFLVLAMAIGTIIGVLSGFAVLDATARGQLISTLLLPVPLVAAMALALALGDYRIPAVISFPVLLAAGAYGRRFGPRWFTAAMLLFFGDFLGFLLHNVLTLGDLGWLVAEIGVAVTIALVVRFAVFYPSRTKALARTRRSYAARVHKVAAQALRLLDGPRHAVWDSARLHGQLIWLNEAALMIDAQLADPRAVPSGSSAHALHQRLHDAELAVANVARFAEAMARLGIPDSQRQAARLALVHLVRGENEAAKAHAARLTGLLRGASSLPAGEDRAVVVIPQRFAASVIALADAMTDWMALGTVGNGPNTTQSAGHEQFQSSVRLLGGWLPGSAKVSNTASLEPGTRLADRVRLPLHVRATIQMGVAVGAATALGDVLSPQRFYWAILAAVVTFMGANTTGEQVRRACLRVAGTVVGIVAGALLASVVGHDGYWSVAVILSATFFGFYLLRISYTFMVTALTVMVSLLYVQLGEFSHALLLLRLEETALGAAVTIVVVTLVLPLRTRRVLRIAFRDHVKAVGQVASHASDHLRGADHATESTLRSDARAADAAYQALAATAQPLRRYPGGSVDGDTGRALRLASAAWSHSRHLVADTQGAGLVDAGTRLDVMLASMTFRQSMDALASALTGAGPGVYTRSSALFDRLDRELEERSGMTHPAQLAIRDLKLLDDTMARLAEGLGLAVAD
jgi:hypothetical protein